MAPAGRAASKLQCILSSEAASHPHLENYNSQSNAKVSGSSGTWPPIITCESEMEVQLRRDLTPNMSTSHIVSAGQMMSQGICSPRLPLGASHSCIVTVPSIPIQVSVLIQLTFSGEA